MPPQVPNFLEPAITHSFSQVTHIPATSKIAEQNSGSLLWPGQKKKLSSFSNSTSTTGASPHNSGLLQQRDFGEIKTLPSAPVNPSFGKKAPPSNWTHARAWRRGLSATFTNPATTLSSLRCSSTPLPPAPNSACVAAHPVISVAIF